MDLFVNCFTVVSLFDFVFLTFQNRRVIASIAVGFPQGTHIGLILGEVESLIDSNALPFPSIVLLRILFFKSFLKIYILNRKIEDSE